MRDINIAIQLTDEQRADNCLIENIDRLTEQLVRADIKGFNFVYDDITGDILINLSESFFDRYKHNARNSGRRRAVAESQTEKELSITGIERQKRYKYSDIVYMLDSGADLEEMLKYTRMAQATYYRHLKELKESTYYKSLNPESCNDRDYLESIKGNREF